MPEDGRVFLCESNIHFTEPPPPAVVKVNLYDFDPESKDGTRVTTMRLCDPCSDEAGAEYPDNIELVERY